MNLWVENKVFLGSRGMIGLMEVLPWSSVISKVWKHGANALEIVREAGVALIVKGQVIRLEVGEILKKSSRPNSIA